MYYDYYSLKIIYIFLQISVVMRNKKYLDLSFLT